MGDLSPFHAGERAMQARAGVAERLAELGDRVLRPFMPDQHRDFFAELPWLILGGLDAEGRPWASPLVGAPGFLGSPDPVTLRVQAQPGYGDPLRGRLGAGTAVGLLGIQPQTRRRNRMNGRILLADQAGFTVRVGQSFGNCPQYIQARRPRFVGDPEEIALPRPVEVEGSVLSPAAAALVARTDTFFIATATADPRGGDAGDGVDVSHRGGRPGFVRVGEEEGATVLTAPDFRGNFFFNTLGNIAVNPRAGLLVVDFDTGDLLQLTGRAEVLWDGSELEAFAGAERLLRFRVEEGRRFPAGLPLRWTAPDYAPQLIRTGTWS
jgi:predicted pyridoxine 5'-phosphate oxidase superfamily flavin-nucleotide-binding protein